MTSQAEDVTCRRHERQERNKCSSSCNNDHQHQTRGIRGTTGDARLRDPERESDKREEGIRAQAAQVARQGLNHCLALDSSRRSSAVNGQSVHLQLRLLTPDFRPQQLFLLLFRQVAPRVPSSAVDERSWNSPFLLSLSCPSPRALPGHGSSRIIRLQDDLQEDVDFCGSRCLRCLLLRTRSRQSDRHDFRQLQQRSK